MTHALVQYGQSPPGNSIAEVTLGTAPVNGNLLIAVGMWWSGSLTAATGWTKIEDVGAAQAGLSAFYKYAGAGESTTQTPWNTPGTNNLTVAMWEISGVTGTWASDNRSVHHAVDIASASSVTSASWNTTGANSRVFGIMAGNMGAGATNVAPTLAAGPTSDGGYTRTPGGVSMTEVFNSFHEDVATSGTGYTVTANYSTTQLKEQWYMFEMVWDAPATNITVNLTAGSMAYTGSPLTASERVTTSLTAGSLTYTGSPIHAGFTTKLTAGSLTYTGSPITAYNLGFVRMSQFGAEALALSRSTAHISQFGMSALGLTDTTLRISQAGAHVLALTNTRTRISQMGLLVLAKGGIPPPTPSPLALPASGRNKVINQRLVNMIYEPTPDGPSNDARFGRGGLVSSAQRGGGPVTSLFDWQGFQFTVSGNTVWRDEENIGVVLAGRNSRFATSETEIVVVTGGRAYYVTTTDVTQMSDFDIPDPVIDVLFAGGRFLYLSDKGIIYYSDVGDARTVDTLSFFTAESRPDNLVGGIVLGNDIALFGTDSVDWYYPTGDDDAPFSGSLGRAYTKGLAAIETLRLADNTGYFLGSDRIVYKMAQSPIRVSSYDVENEIRKVSDEELPFAWAFATTFGGHAYYVISLPGRSTWALDISQNKWSEWKTWNRANFRVRTSSGFYLGDEYTGNIMSFDAQTFTDLDDPLERIVGTYLRHRGPPEKNFKLYLAALRGVGLPTGYGSEPVVEMRYSDDEGHSWTVWMQAPLGAIGRADESAKAIWDQLGTVVSPGRLYEFRVTDPVEFTPYEVRYNEKF